MKRIFTLKNILIALGLILLDLAVYFFLALMLMNYDDFYEESLGPYWSLQSMTFWQQVNYIGLQVWHVLNLGAAAYLGYRVVKEIRKEKKSSGK